MLSLLSESFVILQPAIIKFLFTMKRNFYFYLTVASLMSLPQAMSAQANADIVYKQTFDYQTDLDAMTIIDGNGDGQTWEWEANGFHQGYVMNHRSADLEINDWIITPAIALEGGRAYILTYGARGNGVMANDTQRLNVSFGQGDDYSTYTTLTKDPTVKPSYTFLPFKQYLHVTTSGDYHVAFNDISHYDTYPTYLDDIYLCKGPLLVAPDSVSAFTATAGANGAAEATLTFTAPTKRVDGTALSALTKIEVLRGDVVVKTFSAPAPGAELSFTDKSVESGDVTYTVVAYNAEGDGISTQRTLFVGEDLPGRPENTASTDEGDKILLSWDAPTSGANGHYINTAALKYNVYVVYGYASKKLVAHDVVGTSIEIPNNFEGEQTQNDFEVSAVSSRGEGKSATIPAVILGTPYTLPFAESFPNGTRSTMWWRNDGSVYGGFNLEKGRSYDGDGGCAVFTPIEEDTWAEFCTGKISLKGSKQPTLKFCYLFDTYDESKLQVAVDAPGMKTKIIGVYRRDPLEIDWGRDVLDLSAYKDKPYVIIRFRGTGGDGHDICFDNVAISDGDYDTDLAVSINTTTEKVGGENAHVNLQVANFGNADVRGYSVQLYADGKLVGEARETGTLEAMRSATKVIDYHLPVGKQSVTLQAKVACDGDQNLANNTSDEKAISLSDPVLTPVSGLGMTHTGTTATLSWTAPAANTTTVTESFEDYEPFVIPQADVIGPWNLVDGDQSWTQGIPVRSSETGEVAAYPGDTQEEAFAWMVFDPTLTTPAVSTMYPGTFDAHTGKQYAIAACATDIATTATSNDDWLISPLLTGEEQKVSFYVMSPSTNLAESYEVLTSEATDDTADFTVAASGTVKGTDGWKLVECNLPAGTKYFAIRYCSYDMFMMGLDDITYSTGDGKLTGFNIYRDGKFIATVGAEATSYDDTEAGTATHAYTVTALYSRGESLPAYISTGIGAVTADDDASATLYNVGGQRIGNAQRGGVVIVRKANGQTFKILRK